MLRSFLCRDALLAQITVPSLLLAVFLLPLGFAIDSFIDANFGVSSVWVRWLFFGLPLVTLAGIWLWILGAKYCGCVYAAPWALSPRTLSPQISTCCEHPGCGALTTNEGLPG